MNRERGGSNPPLRVESLYVVGRRDLGVGFRTVQMGHAAISWVLEHGRPPDNLVWLEAKNLDDLHQLYDRVKSFRMVGFHEPDIGDELTAIAVGPEGWKKLSSYPLVK